MNVEQILKSKGKHDVETIRADATVAEAAGVLSAKKIGALVVASEPGEIGGIVSERDVVRLVGRDGPSSLELKVSEIMTEEVESCRPGESAMSVLGRMTEGRFRHMPVLEGDRMIGLVSIGDVVKARIEDIERENAAMAEMLRG
ncbi:MAG TPA: CBS domain-containing protein [Thermohalobaculum sp.]|nr:CBS domain-containing protein [Thermohalobaculum sp.]